MSDAPRFAALVTQKGYLVFADEPAWRFVLGRWKGRRLTVTLEPERRIRSGQQNRRGWGRIVRGVRGYLNAGREMPLSTEQVHYVLASAFLGCEETPLGLVPRQTRNLTTKQHADYCDRIEAHFAGLGVEFEPIDAVVYDDEGERVGGWEQ